MEPQVYAVFSLWNLAHISLVDCDFKLSISVRVSGFLPLVITGEVKGWQIVAEDET